MEDPTVPQNRRFSADPFAKCCGGVLCEAAGMNKDAFVDYFALRGYKLYSSSCLYAVFTGRDARALCRCDLNNDNQIIPVEYVAENAFFLTFKDSSTTIAEKDGVFVVCVSRDTSKEHRNALVLRDKFGASCSVYKAVASWPGWKLAKIPAQPCKFRVDAQ